MGWRLWQNGRHRAHDVLFLNRKFSDASCEIWSDASIRQRTDELAKSIVEIWPVPDGHRSPQGTQQTHYSHRVDLLISSVLAGCSLEQSCIRGRRNSPIQRQLCSVTAVSMLVARSTRRRRLMLRERSSVAFEMAGGSSCRSSNEKRSAPSKNSLPSNLFLRTVRTMTSPTTMKNSYKSVRSRRNRRHLPFKYIQSLYCSEQLYHVSSTNLRTASTCTQRPPAKR